MAETTEPIKDEKSNASKDTKESSTPIIEKSIPKEGTNINDFRYENTSVKRTFNFMHSPPKVVNIVEPSKPNESNEQSEKKVDDKK